MYILLSFYFRLFSVFCRQAFLEYLEKNRAARAGVGGKWRDLQI
jgi:hypothetical protein